MKSSFKMIATLLFSCTTVFLLSSSSCTKRESDIVSSKMPGNTTIKGRLTTLAGNKGIAKHTCYAYWLSDDGRVVRFKNAFQTDENGFYEVAIYLRKSESNSGSIHLTLVNNSDYIWKFNASEPENSNFFFSKRNMLIGEIAEQPPFEIHTISFLEVGLTDLPPINSNEYYQVKITSPDTQLFSATHSIYDNPSMIKIDVPAGMNLQVEVGIFRSFNFVPYKTIQVSALAPKEVRSL